jgi:hypothetical protein
VEVSWWTFPPASVIDPDPDVGLVTNDSFLTAVNALPQMPLSVR